MFRFSPIFNDFSMDYRWLSLINLWLISWLIIGGLALDLRYLDRCTPQSPDPIGDHNRPFAIGSKFSLKTNTFSFQKKLLASELWKQFMLPYFALILPSIWQICRYSTLTTDILEKSVICNNFGFYHRFRGKFVIFGKSVLLSQLFPITVRIFINHEEKSFYKPR